MNSKRLPATRPPAPRVIHYIDPAALQGLAHPTRAQLARQRAAQDLLVARWRTRQETIAMRDRKVRRFWLGFGAVFGLAVIAAVVTAGWLLWTGIGLGILAVPVLIALVAALAVGGHRCITIVQHWH